LEAPFELTRARRRGDVKIANRRICRSTVEFQRSATEFYRKCYMCPLSEPSFAVGLDQNVPAAVRAKLDMIRCYLADLGARTCLIEPRSTIEPRRTPGISQGARPELKAGIST
jgi:hypothetical protein